MKGPLFCLFLTVRLFSLPAAQALPEFDFTQAEVCAQWQAAHDIRALRPTPEGLEISISGNDPYFQGPARDYPVGVPLWLGLRLKSGQGGIGQVFHFRDYGVTSRTEGKNERTRRGSRVSKGRCAT